MNVLQPKSLQYRIHNSYSLVVVVTLILALGLLPNLSRGEEQNWQSLIELDPLQNKKTCLIISKTLYMNDGQTQTPVRILYNGSAFVIGTKSNIDMSYPALGIRVDNNARIPLDRILGETDVVFERHAEQLKVEFIKGRQARVALGFWPSWPKSATRYLDVSLMGFHNAYQAFEACQADPN